MREKIKLTDKFLTKKGFVSDIAEHFQGVGVTLIECLFDRGYILFVVMADRKISTGVQPIPPNCLPIIQFPEIYPRGFVTIDNTSTSELIPLCRCLPCVLHPKTDVWGSHRAPVPPNLSIMNVGVGASLISADFAGYVHRGLGRAVGHQRETQSYKEERGANANQPSLNVSIVTHFLCGIVHGPRSFVHSLLGDKVINLVLAGFGFAALAGFGGGLILDDFNRERNRIRLGWLFLLTCLPILVASVLLGLPQANAKNYSKRKSYDPSALRHCSMKSAESFPRLTLFLRLRSSSVPPMDSSL